MGIDHSLDSENAPTEVKAAPGLKSDLDALVELNLFDMPTLQLLHGVNINQVIYGLGDASKEGLCTSLRTTAGLKYCIRVWGSSLSQNSSNWHELQNLVDSLEEEETLGNPNGAK
eukprot:13166169-Ditylum_brightwellii.AAC.1